MIDERALWLWAHELHQAMGGLPVGEIKRVLQYAYGLGTVIPEKHLITGFLMCYQSPPSRKIAREVLSEMGMIPKA